jgi:hypothetical protein
MTSHVVICDEVRLLRCSETPSNVTFHSSGWAKLCLEGK